jgi:hypothetical protein
LATWWLFGLILFIVGSPFVIASLILSFGLLGLDDEVLGTNITISFLYFEITVVIIWKTGLQTLIPFSIQLFVYAIPFHYLYNR